MDERIHSNDAFGPRTAGTLPDEPTRVSLDPLHGVIEGLASLGMTFIIGSPATMHLIWELWNSRFRGFTKIEIILVAVCGFFGFLVILASAVFGLIFGITAIVPGATGTS